MKRWLVLCLVLGLVAGALAPAQAKKKKPRKPVPVNVTYSVVWSSDTCALSTDTSLADATQSCGDSFAGSTTGDIAGSGAPVVFSAIDGTPLTLDASKPIRGSFVFGSYTLAALADAGHSVPLGIGQAQWHISLQGTSGNEDVTIGEVDTDAYTVTPGTQDYKVDFEIAPGADLTGKVLNALSLSVEQVGSATLHGKVSADATSKLTIGAFAAPK